MAVQPNNPLFILKTWWRLLPFPVGLKSTWPRQLRHVHSSICNSCWRGCRSSSCSVTRTQRRTSNCWSCSASCLRGCTAGKERMPQPESVFFTDRELSHLICTMQLQWFKTSVASVVKMANNHTIFNALYLQVLVLISVDCDNSRSRIITSLSHLTGEWHLSQFFVIYCRTNLDQSKM